MGTLIKTYVLVLSKTFPSWHPRKGELTEFREKFINGQARTGDVRKIHTIRANYPLWEKRIKEVQEGKAVLSIRQWSGRPYASKQEIIETLSALDGVGIQKLEIINSYGVDRYVIPGPTGVLFGMNPEALAINDGLSLADWMAWFKDYPRSKPLAVIHFTNGRY